MIPVILPPSIFRLRAEPHTSLLLPSKPVRDGKQDGRNCLFPETCLDYRVGGHLDFLRTNDFTPQQAFGRSFAYRQAPAVVYI